MKFIVDAQLPLALVDWIRGQGHIADHVRELGLRDAEDQAVWDTALALGAAIVTKDHDFVEWATTRRPCPQVIWIRIGNVTNLSLTARIDGSWNQIVSDLKAGAQVVEVGRP